MTALGQSIAMGLPSKYNITLLTTYSAQHLHWHPLCRLHALLALQALYSHIVIV